MSESKMAHYWALARQLAAGAREGPPLKSFLDDAGHAILEFTTSDAVEVWLGGDATPTRYVLTSGARSGTWSSEPTGGSSASSFEAQCRGVIEPVGQELRSIEWTKTPEGSHWVFPFRYGPDRERSRGLIAVRLSSGVPDRVNPESLQEVVRDFGASLDERRVHASLRERMKELNCLYRMALVVEHPGHTLEDVLQGVIEVLPDAWLHPTEIWVRLRIDGREYRTGKGEERPPELKKEVKTAGAVRGHLRIGYSEDQPEMDEGPFLDEEITLLESVAREIALIIERHDMAAERQQLEQQLRHAERLATVGELAAGLAHELNDPLNNILGYGQFIGKHDDLPADARADAEVVVASALHARGVLRQLLTFARRMPQQREGVRLDGLVTEALPLLRAICAQEGVEIEIDSEPGVPEVSADPGQLRQVVVNLVSNAAQANAEGGKVKISVRADVDREAVRLIVEDDGEGMAEEVIREALLPFFTTRENGTGLGLAVVHGIVESHGGTIGFDSAPGEGTRVDVLLPQGASTQDKEAG